MGQVIIPQCDCCPPCCGSCPQFSQFPCAFYYFSDGDPWTLGDPDYYAPLNADINDPNSAPLVLSMSTSPSTPCTWSLSQILVGEPLLTIVVADTENVWFLVNRSTPSQNTGWAYSIPLNQFRPCGDNILALNSVAPGTPAGYPNQVHVTTKSHDHAAFPDQPCQCTGCQPSFCNTCTLCSRFPSGWLFHAQGFGGTNAILPPPMNICSAFNQLFCLSPQYSPLACSWRSAAGKNSDRFNGDQLDASLTFTRSAISGNIIATVLLTRYVGIVGPNNINIQAKYVALITDCCAPITLSFQQETYCQGQPNAGNPQCCPPWPNSITLQPVDCNCVTQCDVCDSGGISVGLPQQVLAGFRAAGGCACANGVNLSMAYSDNYFFGPPSAGALAQPFWWGGVLGCNGLQIVAWMYCLPRGTVGLNGPGLYFEAGIIAGAQDFFGNPLPPGTPLSNSQRPDGSNGTSWPFGYTGCFSLTPAIGLAVGYAFVKPPNIPVVDGRADTFSCDPFSWIINNRIVPGSPPGGSPAICLPGGLVQCPQGSVITTILTEHP